MANATKEAPIDIFDNEAIMANSTICKVGTMRIVLSKDGMHEYHFLVMPIRHVENLEELSGEDFESLKKAVSVIKEFYKSHGINSHKEVLLSGKGAGQTVPHLHWHFVPGGVEFIVDPNKRQIHYDNETLKQKTESFRKEFEGIKKTLSIK